MPGWYSIIPVYADYKLCERVHRGDETRTFLMAYLIVLICSWAFCWVDTVGVLLALAQLVMTIIVLNDMSRAFGKETGYTIGQVALPRGVQCGRPVWFAERFVGSNVGCKVLTMLLVSRSRWRYGRGLRIEGGNKSP